MCTNVLSRLLKVDPALLDTLNRYEGQLNAGDYENVTFALTSVSLADREWRKAIFRLFDAKLLDLGVPVTQEDVRLNARLFPVGGKVVVILLFTLTDRLSLSCSMGRQWQEKFERN